MMKTSGEEFPAETVGIKVPAGDEARQEKRTPGCQRVAWGAVSVQEWL